MEQHVALGLIGVAAGDQRLGHGDHAVDVLGRARLEIGRQRAERRHVFVEHLGGARGDRSDRLAGLLSRRVDLVVNVGDVAHVGDVALAIEAAQQAVEHVEHESHVPSQALVHRDSARKDSNARMRCQ